MLNSPSNATLIAELSPAALRGRYQGVFSLSWQLAGAAAPILGGLVRETRRQQRALARLRRHRRRGGGRPTCWPGPARERRAAALRPRRSASGPGARGGRGRPDPPRVRRFLSTPRRDRPEAEIRYGRTARKRSWRNVCPACGGGGTTQPGTPRRAAGGARAAAGRRRLAPGRAGNGVSPRYGRRLRSRSASPAERARETTAERPPRLPRDGRLPYARRRRDTHPRKRRPLAPPVPRASPNGVLHPIFASRLRGPDRSTAPPNGNKRDAVQ